MAVGIDMFGTGGEGLGGLFVGNQMAMQRDAAELERQKAMQDMANAQSQIRARDLETSFQEQTMPDRVAAERDKAAGIKAKNDQEKFARTGEQFGQFSAVLNGVPALARPAVLKSMAAQAGIGEDNPMYQSLSQVPPEELPNVLNQISQGFYEQSTAGRAERLKKEEARITQREKDEAAMERTRATNDLRREIAGGQQATLRAIASMREGGANQRAAAKAAGKAGGPDFSKMGLDRSIAYLEMKRAVEGELSEGEENALVNMKEQRLNERSVGKEETTADIMGTRTPQERARSMARGESTPSTTAAKPNAAPKVGTESKGYRFKGGDPSKKENWEKI